jgi:hypothetical protein
MTPAIGVSVVIRMPVGHMRRGMPVTAYPHAARPITRRPHVTCYRAGRSHRHHRRGSHINYGRRGRNHDGRRGSDCHYRHGKGRQRQTNRKAEANSGVS